MDTEALIADYRLSGFERAFAHVVQPDVEGIMSIDSQDPGNWTGGAIGKGELKGTRFGISASRYPTLNIAAVTVTDARGLYKRDFWDAARCDEFPEALAFCVFDSAVNQGPTTAVKILQRSLGVTDDGIVGAHTLKAAHAISPHDAVVEFQAERIVAYANLGTWHLFGRGWARRDIRTAIAALQ